MKQKTYLTLTPLVFLVIAAVHLIRVWKGWDVTVGDNDIQLWVSWAAVVVAGYLSYSGYQINK